MKKFISTIAAIAILNVAALSLILSCSSEPTDENTPSSGSNSGNVAKSSSSSIGNNNSASNGNNGSQAMENGPAYRHEDEKKYTGENLKIYMADKRDQNYDLILTEETMLEIGTMNNGEVSLALPQSVNSRFLTKIDEAPPGMEFKPLGVEVWFYKYELRLIDNSRKHLCNLRYYKKAGDMDYYVYYWYFSGNVKINGIVGGSEYNIDAKKGWNKVYARIKHLADQSVETYFATDLSKVPDGLKWLVEEI